jgi:hypothetical protein
LRFVLCALRVLGGEILLSADCWVLNLLNASPMIKYCSMSATAMSVAIERYFHISLYLLVVAGFATLGTTGKLDLPSLLLVSSGLAVRGWLLITRNDFSIPARWDSWITLLYVVFYICDYFLLSAGTPTPFVSATVHLVLFVMVVKIFSVRRDRDYLYLALLSFLEVLAASVLTADALFLAAFTVFLVIAVNTFVALEMFRSTRQAAVCALDFMAGPRRATRALLFSSWALVLGIMLLGTILFFAIPRATAGYLSAFAPTNPVVTGFSNEVNLGRIGEIQQLSTVVMYVQVPGGRRAGMALKLRGVALGLFDGQRWSNPAQDAQSLTRTSGQFDLAPLYRRWNDVMIPPRGRGPVYMLRYRVLMEPIGTNVFFLAPKPQMLAGPYRAVMTDPGGAIRNQDRDRIISSYEAVSVLEQRDARELRRAGAEYPAEIELRYLQTPKRFDPRVRALAEQITAHAPTPYDKAQALESYLRTTYGYTLQLPAASPPDPVANFLLERKQGHCELFASAMTVMLRAINIPARLVNGFNGGEFNPLTGSYVVRARDAHSWVEAYFPGDGWVTFDPTPVDSNASPGGAWHQFLLYVDAGREFWRDWIVNYDFSHQRSLTISAMTRGRSNADSLRAQFMRRYFALFAAARRTYELVRRAPVLWTATTAVILACVLFAVNSRRAWRALTGLRAGRHPERAPQTSASLWYARLLRHLGRRGWHKLPAQTSADFAVNIADPELKLAVCDFTTHYQRARFAGSAADAQRLPELFAQIRSH